MKETQEIQIHLNVYIPKPNVECFPKSFRYAGGKVWNGVPNNKQNVPSVEALDIPIRNSILNTGTLGEGSNIIYKNNCIILMCMIYSFIFDINCIVYPVYNRTGPN